MVFPFHIFKEPHAAGPHPLAPEGLVPSGLNSTKSSTYHNSNPVEPQNGNFLQEVNYLLDLDTEL